MKLRHLRKNGVMDPNGGCGFLRCLYRGRQNRKSHNESGEINKNCTATRSQHELESNAAHRYMDTPLIRAVNIGNLDSVRALLDGSEKAEVDGRIVSSDPKMNDCTALHVACLARNYAIALELVIRGADIGALNEDGMTPLMFAAENGSAEIVTELLSGDRTSDRLTDDQKQIALLTACLNGHRDVALVLIDHGASVSKPNDDGQTPLILAAKRASGRFINELIDLGAGIDSRMKSLNKFLNDATALMVASRSGNIEAVVMLLDKGADLHATNSMGMTPLCFAAMDGTDKVVDELLKRGARENTEFVNVPIESVKSMYDGATALHFACHGQNITTARRLLEMNANPWIRCSDGTTALMTAVKKGSLEIVKELVERSSNEELLYRTNEPTRNGFTALHFAAMGEKIEIARLLLDNGVDPNVKSAEGVTPLMAAAHSGITKMAAELIKRGASVQQMAEAENSELSGYTALHFACACGNLELINLLLHHGADRMARNASGMTPLSLLPANLSVDSQRLSMDFDFCFVKSLGCHLHDNSYSAGSHGSSLQIHALSFSDPEERSGRDSQSTSEFSGQLSSGSSTTISSTNQSSPLLPEQRKIELMDVLDNIKTGDRVGKYEVMDGRIANKPRIRFARDTQSHLSVILKFLDSGEALEKTKHFHQRLRKSEYVCKMYDVVNSYPPCLVLEAGNWTLEQKMRETDIDIGDQKSMLYDVICGVRDMHIESIVFRDLNPATVMFIPTDRKWKISDLDFAVDIGSEEAIDILTRYAAPETIEMYLSDPRQIQWETPVNLWAVGMLAFEMATYCRLYGGGSSDREIRDRSEFFQSERFIPEINDLDQSPFYPIIKNMLKLDARSRWTADQAAHSRLFTGDED